MYITIVTHSTIFTKYFFVNDKIFAHNRYPVTLKSPVLVWQQVLAMDIAVHYVVVMAMLDTRNQVPK